MPGQGCAPTAGFLLLGPLLLSLMAPASSCLCSTECWAGCWEMLVSPAGNNLCAPAVPQCPQELITSGVWLLVGSEQSSKCPAYSFLAATPSSLLHILSLVEMAKSCFSALLLPFPYLKVVIFSHQSSLNLNKPNSFPGRSCFLDLITFFLWILSRAMALQLWICTAEQSRRKIPWACNCASLQRKSAICKFRISWFALICSLASWCL